MELARGSHRWPTKADPQGEFHAPDDYRTTVAAAAETAGAELDIAALELTAGNAAFHHGWAWHGSGPNRSGAHRRALVLHCASSEARFCRAADSVRATARSTSRYARLNDDEMDENHFPILWRRDGYRTPGI